MPEIHPFSLIQIATDYITDTMLLVLIMHLSLLCPTSPRWGLGGARWEISTSNYQTPHPLGEVPESNPLLYSLSFHFFSALISKMISGSWSPNTSWKHVLVAAAYSPVPRRLFPAGMKMWSGNETSSRSKINHWWSEQAVRTLELEEPETGYPHTIE